MRNCGTVWGSSNFHCFPPKFITFSDKAVVPPLLPYSTSCLQPSWCWRVACKGLACNLHANYAIIPSNHEPSRGFLWWWLRQVQHQETHVSPPKFAPIFTNAKQIPKATCWLRRRFCGAAGVGHGRTSRRKTLEGSHMSFCRIFFHGDTSTSKFWLSHYWNPWFSGCPLSPKIKRKNWIPNASHDKLTSCNGEL